MVDLMMDACDEFDAQAAFSATVRDGMCSRGTELAVP